MKRNLILIIAAIFLCSIIGGYYLTAQQMSLDPLNAAKEKNKTSKQIPKNLTKENGTNDVEAGEEEGYIISEMEDPQSSKNLNKNWEQVCTDYNVCEPEETVKILASEYGVSEEEVKKNMEYYLKMAEWENEGNLAHAQQEITVTKEFKYNGHELALYDDEIENLHGDEGLKILANWISKNFTWKRGAATTADGVLKTHYGDCWGLTDLCKHILLSGGYSFKVLDITTSESKHHRALEVKKENGDWERFDPTLCSKTYLKPYFYEIGTVNKVLEVYQ